MLSGAAVSARSSPSRKCGSEKSLRTQSCCGCMDADGVGVDRQRKANASTTTALAERKAMYERVMSLHSLPLSEKVGAIAVFCVRFYFIAAFCNFVLCFALVCDGRAAVLMNAGDSSGVDVVPSVARGTEAHQRAAASVSTRPQHARVQKLADTCKNSETLARWQLLFNVFALLLPLLIWLVDLARPA
eukprot:2094960-Rhodomonas_salina.1